MFRAFRGVPNFETDPITKHVLLPLFPYAPIPSASGFGEGGFLVPKQLLTGYLER